MTKEIKNKIKKYLENNENITFGLIFGSQANNKAKFLSDIDIGIYTLKELDLLEIGRLVFELEKVTAKKVDLINLNNLFKKDPTFAFEVIANSEILFIKEPEKLTEFKKQVFLHFMDTEFLRKQVRKNLIKRIDEQKFGLFNHA